MINKIKAQRMQCINLRVNYHRESCSYRSIHYNTFPIERTAVVP